MEKREIQVTRMATAGVLGKRTNGNCKPVLCITTGQIFASGYDAAEITGVHQSCISAVCRGKQKVANGMEFCFVHQAVENIDAIAACLAVDHVAAPVKKKRTVVHKTKPATIKSCKKLTFKDYVAAKMLRLANVLTEVK